MEKLDGAQQDGARMAAAAFVCDELQGAEVVR